MRKLRCKEIKLSALHAVSREWSHQSGLDCHRWNFIPGPLFSFGLEHTTHFPFVGHFLRCFIRSCSLDEMVLEYWSFPGFYSQNTCFLSLNSYSFLGFTYNLNGNGSYICVSKATFSPNGMYIYNHPPGTSNLEHTQHWTLSPFASLSPSCPSPFSSKP